MKVQAINNDNRNFKARLISRTSGGADLRSWAYDKNLSVQNTLYNALKIIKDDKRINTFEMKAKSGHGTFNIYLDGNPYYDEANPPIMESFFEGFMKFFNDYYKGQDIVTKKTNETEHYEQLQNDLPIKIMALEKEVADAKEKAHSNLSSKVNKLFEIVHD